MKLLLDENLSESLVGMLTDIFPDTQHVRTVGLEGADDRQVWNFSARNNRIIVSKDSDFREFAMIFESEIKVIWIRLGNCSTANIHLLLRNKFGEICAFSVSDDTVLELP